MLRFVRGATVRSATNPPAVEELIVLARQCEVKDSCVFNEERAPLTLKCLECTEINHCGIGFYLPEIRVDCGI